MMFPWRDLCGFNNLRLFDEWCDLILDAFELMLNRFQSEINKLQSEVHDLRATIAEIMEAHAQALRLKDLHIEKLSHELARLKRQLFGRSREASADAPVQGELFGAFERIESPAQDQKAVVQKSSSSQPKGSQPRREPLPLNLPSVVTVLDLPEHEKLGLQKIGEERSERLVYQPGILQVEVTVRPKYTAPNQPERGVLTAAVPASVIPGGLYHESFLSHVIVSKFADHIPLSRLISQCARMGYEPALSTLCSSVLTVATVWLQPIVDALWLKMKMATAIHVDETLLATLPTPKSGQREVLKTRLWTYYVDFAGHIFVLYHYTETKAGVHVRKMLSDWPGSRTCYLQADAASNYDALYREQPLILEVACWAHARRKFFDIAKNSSSRIFAHEALEQINALFELEREWKSLSPDDRKTRRWEHAKPQLDAIEKRFTQKLQSLPPKTPTAGAISYVLKNWAAFTRYLDTGYLQLDNNAAERALRKAALGRKNFLFVGNERGGEAAALCYSVLETAKANGLEPWAWLSHVLTELPRRNSNAPGAIEDLLPLRRG
jgi:transposase